MAHSKDRHYWSQLRSALTAGLWASPTPAKTPKGQGLSWHELLRKFKKHVHGHDEVASVASQTQILALSLGKDVGSSPSNKSPLDLGGESILPEDRRGDANAGLKTLKTLEKSNLNSLLLLLAYYSYAVDQPSECLLYLSKVSDLGDVESHIPPNAPSSTRTDGTSSNLQAPSANGRPASITSSQSNQGVDEGRSWALTEAIRSFCLKGMSHEKLSPAEPGIALDAYCAALPLLATVESEIPRALPPNFPGDFTCFERFRELWIWVDRLLWRAVSLAAQTCPINGAGEDDRFWKLLSHYRTCSAYWPPKFNAEHRSTVATLHLRALHKRARISASVPSSVLEPEKLPAWLGEARAVVNDYRAILTVSTHFPKAGQRNTQVEDFVDLCVAIWEAAGAVGDQAGWVIDILWWATRLTFNSYRIFRHMTRLFYVAGDTQLARRTLRLYVQVVGKAYEAGGAGVGVDADSDRHWVETLTQGARMLCRVAGPTGVEEAREAGTLIDKAKKRLRESDKDLVASVHLAEGIWSATTAMVEHDARMRASRMAHALAQFAASVESYPTPSGYYHLAIALARSGPQQNLEEAVSSASSGVEGAPQDIRYWHLLGLLLTAQGKWREAKGVLEIGAAIGDDGEDGSDSSEEAAAEDGVQIRDFGTQPPGSTNGAIPNGHTHPPEVRDSHKGPIYLLEKDSTTIGPSASLLQPLPDYPSPSRQDIFEHALQLRMTQLAVSESVDGAEGAGLKWVEVFGWVAQRKGPVADHRRSSIDTARNSEETRQHSEYTHTNTHGSEGPHLDSSGQNGVEEPNSHREKTDLPPITVTPATPADANPSFLSEEKRSDSIDRESTGKKVQQLVKDRVQKSQAKISTVSKKIGRGMVKSPSLRRASSAPDFQALLAHKPYQASSIHSRRRMSFIRHTPAVPAESLLPPPPPPTPSPDRKDQKSNRRAARDSRLLSDLWLQSAATFRRLGKIEQAKGAIQEGEVRDEDNPAVWVQLGLYYAALGHHRDAMGAFQKALFIAPEDVSATVHLCRLYLTPQKRPKTSHQQEDDLVSPGDVDLASGMLSYAVRGPAWDVPEAWYFLAKAYGLQGRKDKEREALTLALSLSEQRTVRDVGLAVGWCL